jgi:hypothetical protein
MSDRGEDRGVGWGHEGSVAKEMRLGSSHLRNLAVAFI